VAGRRCVALEDELCDFIMHREYFIYVFSHDAYVVLGFVSITYSIIYCNLFPIKGVVISQSLLNVRF